MNDFTMITTPVCLPVMGVAEAEQSPSVPTVHLCVSSVQGDFVEKSQEIRALNWRIINSIFMCLVRFLSNTKRALLQTWLLPYKGFQQL